MANEKAKYQFGTFGFSLTAFRGEATGEEYSGNFEAKKSLSMRDFLQKDAMRRSLLGDKPESASQQALVYAEALSHCSVSLVDGPKFWKDANGGIDLYDDNVVLEVYTKVVDGQMAAAEEIVKKGEAAKTELKKKKE